MEESTGGAGGKERRVTFRMEGGDYDALCERCERAGLSKSEWIGNSYLDTFFRD